MGEEDINMKLLGVLLLNIKLKELVGIFCFRFWIFLIVHAEMFSKLVNELTDGSLTKG